MNTHEILASASVHLQQLAGHVFDVLTISKPRTPSATLNLTKILSKLSPLLGNLIEFNTVEFLNAQTEYRLFGRWVRQDPGFPDAVFVGHVTPTPGFEIKAWFPLSTEITARFKDSQEHFTHNQTYVCMLAWLPDHLIYGQPRIIDVCVVSGRSVAESRDKHYHNPPGYLVIEPEDTTGRTRNLQQTNTSGYKFQGTPQQFTQAQKLTEDWDLRARGYQTTFDYQTKLRQLQATFPYRLDTNFAKMDRIMHRGIENFKKRVLDRQLHGMAIKEWSRIIYGKSSAAKQEALNDLDQNHRKED